MTPRRITLVTSEPLGRPGTGGAGTADSLLAVALGRHGHQVELLVATGRDIGRLNEEWNRIYHSAGVSVRVLQPLAGVRPQHLAPTLEVFNALRERDADVVIVNDWRGLGYAAMRSRQLGRALTETAFVVHCHGPARVLAEFAGKVPDTLERFREEVTERASIELADAVVSPSAWLLGWMRAHGWLVPDSARVIQYVRQSAALAEPPGEAPPATPVRRLAFFGQLREGKGLRIFLSALDTLDPELLEGVELIFLGSESKRWTSDRILSALSAESKERLAGISFETALDRDSAFEQLRWAGTLAVMPSLLDNSPNTVSECIEQGVPFIATDTGGIPELVAAEDRPRVLAPPTPDALAAALTRALASRPGFAAARPDRDPRESLEAWLELIDRVTPPARRDSHRAGRVAVVATGEKAARRAQRLAERTRSVEVQTVEAGTRAAGLTEADAEWVVFLDAEDEPDDGMLDALVAAQAASEADVVTAGVRPADDPAGIELFLGSPGALGLIENQYGVLGLIRRELLDGEPPPEGSVDADWPLFARLTLAGARIVCIPEALSLHGGEPGRVDDVPGEGLAVLEAFEQRTAGDLPQLAATLGAAYARIETERRRFDRARPQGVNGFTRRAAGRIRRMLSAR